MFYADLVTVPNRRFEMQDQIEAAAQARRVRLDNCKENYAHHNATTLQQVVRFNTIKANAITRDLEDGTAAKAWRHSSDLRETLAQIAWKRDELLLVAEAAKELLGEREEAAVPSRKFEMVTASASQMFAVPSGKSIGWHAGCTKCGWFGPDRTSQNAAEGDALAHRCERGHD